MFSIFYVILNILSQKKKKTSNSCPFEPHHQKICLRGLQPGKTQIGLLSYGDLSLEILDLASIGIILSRQGTRKVLIRLQGCAG